ncbi:MAG: (Fe-S)-binding protein [Candidatus Lokiarchaeota archaeon]|nr:(Fe-S)-binding protein [Candidatus Lokiarchaeota archaeon]
MSERGTKRAAHAAGSTRPASGAASQTSFKWDACTGCGTCLASCPVLRLPVDEAKREIRNLIDGKASKVLTKCNTCFSCNLHCPEHANPYQLILSRWNDVYHRRGAPPLYKFVCPTSLPNIWQVLNLFLQEKERRWIREWMAPGRRPSPGKDLLLVGNYTHLFPFIIGGSKLLDSFTPVDLIDQWEGGAYLYQGGYLDVVSQIAARTKRDLDDLGATRVVSFLDAVQYIYTVVHPSEFGVHHGQEFTSITSWLRGQLETGALEVVKPLKIRVTVHDNCYSKAIGAELWDGAREILGRCGCKVVEMEHCKADSLCCGFGAGASWKHNVWIPFKIIREGMKKFAEASRTGASALVSYCSGCIYLLWATRELLESRLDVYHLVEVVRMAAGEELDYPRDHVGRAWDVIAIITYQLVRSLLDRPFRITAITYDPGRSTFRPRSHVLLRFIRALLSFRLARRFYARLFRLMAGAGKLVFE